MHSKMPLVSFILATLLPFAQAQNIGQEESGKEVLLASQKLYKEEQYSKALDLLEPELRKQQVNYNYYYDFWSTEEFMASMYVRSKQVDRGVKYFHELFLEKKDLINERKGYFRLEDNLLDLALRNNSFDIAMEVMHNRKQREDYPGWDLDFARIYAAEGNMEQALIKLRSYLDDDGIVSRTQILAMREFMALHKDPNFRELVTETEQLVKDRYEKYRRKAGIDEPVERHSFEEIRSQAEVYKKIVDAQSIEGLRAELSRSDEMIQPHVEAYKDELFELLRSEKEHTCYRLILAGHLARIEDPSFTKKVVQEVKEDDFLQFPRQLFFLAYTLACRDPEAAKPFLMQMLKGSKETFFQVQHFRNLNWTQILIQVFGCGESCFMDDMLTLAEKNDPTKSKNALLLLTVFQEPRLVPLLAEKIRREDDKEAKSLLIRYLGSCYFPQTVDALKKIREELNEGDKETADLIRSIREQLKPPPTVLYPNEDGVAIDDPEMRRIFFDNLAVTSGKDISFLPKTLFLTVKKSDIPRLRDIRSRIFHRFSDEASYDWKTVSSIISWLYWHGE